MDIDTIASSETMPQVIGSGELKKRKKERKEKGGKKNAKSRQNIRHFRGLTD
ncbi:MAG: hypothetical protein AB2693_23170 [Candidatus Thiodiazotropha sp.]